MGYEAGADLLVTAGAALALGPAERPGFFLGVSYTFFSPFYQAAYSWMARMETAFTHRWIYQSGGLGKGVE